MHLLGICCFLLQSFCTEMSFMFKKNW